MSESRIFSLGSLTLEQVGQRVEQFLRSQGGMHVESVHGPGGYLVQARLEGQDWRKFVGLDKALQVHLTPIAAGTISVTVGEGKWLDKLGVGAVGALWFFPLAVAAGVGALGQLKLANDVLAEVERYVLVAGGPAPAQPQAAPEPAADAWSDPSASDASWTDASDWKDVGGTADD